jgi:predicted small lipoprotein YifL
MSLIKKQKSLTAIFIMTLMLSGCGQKGALYLADEAAEPPQASSSSVDDRDKKSR